MKKHPDSIDAPQLALAVTKSTRVRRHRRKAEIRQHVIQESRNGEQRTITSAEAARWKCCRACVDAASIAWITGTSSI
ncbi:MAG: hypothetical protein ACRD5L_16040, partial [Bryobacteraceae bacterium]